MRSAPMLLLMIGLALSLQGCGGTKEGEPTVQKDDLDGDGYGAASDCDDASAAIHPEAEERCNGLDDNCDGQTDEAGALGGLQVYTDADGDGVGSGNPVERCERGVGTSLLPGDCDDSDAGISPLATERCDGVDDDCDGLTDEPGTPDGETLPLDRDGDGYGHPLLTGVACGPGDGYADNIDDCDDGDPTRNPAEPEICTNGQDDDCDGVVDETDDPNTPVWYADEDGDGYGGSDIQLFQCAAPVGYTQQDTDCDDSDADVHPAQPDGINEIDDDCDGLVDELGDSVGSGTLTVQIGTRRSGCTLVWDTTYVELPEASPGDYTWEVTNTFNASDSDAPYDCDYVHSGEDFTYTMAFYYHGLFGGQEVSLREDRDGRSYYRYYAAAELHWGPGTLAFTSDFVTDDGTEGTLTGDADFVGL